MTKTATTLIIPQIIAGTFVATGEPYQHKHGLGEVTEGTIQVQFGDQVITTKAERLVRYVGFTIDRAFGFMGRAKTGKIDYKLSVTHRVEDDEYLCQIGSSIRNGTIWYAGE